MTLSKELTKYKRLFYVSICMAIFLEAFLFYNLFMYKDYPQIVLYKGTFSTKEVEGDSYSFLGQYNPVFNRISVSLNTSELTHVLLHEYGHYVNYKILTSQQKAKVKEFCKNDTIPLPQYIKLQRCGELFAEHFYEVVYFGQNDTAFKRYIYNITKNHIQ